MLNTNEAAENSLQSTADNDLIQDVGHWFVDTFKEDLYRSREFKRTLYDMRHEASRELYEVLAEPRNRFNYSAKMKAIEMVFSNLIIKSELPKVQREYTSANGASTTVTGVGWEPYKVSEEEVREFLKGAIEVEGEDNPHKVLVIAEKVEGDK